MTPWVLRLIAANVVVFLLQMTLPPIFQVRLSLYPALVLQQPWTVVTYMFLHGGLSHIFFNMFGLVIFGPRVENRLGGRRFLILYFIAGLGGAAGAFFTTMPTVPVIGASGALFGVMLAYARFWPRDQLLIWGLLPVEARVLVIGYTVLELFLGVGGLQQGVAHFAHVGGFVTALVYLLMLERQTGARRFRQRTQAPRRPPPDGDALARWSTISRDGLHELTLNEIDRLMLKVRTSGVASLTPEERAYLDRMSA
jgi:membrane associated rhomboid family serine protease